MVNHALQLYPTHHGLTFVTRGKPDASLEHYPWNIFFIHPETT